MAVRMSYFFLMLFHYLLLNIMCCVPYPVQSYELLLIEYRNYTSLNQNLPRSCVVKYLVIVLPLNSSKIIFCVICNRIQDVT